MLSMHTPPRHSYDSPMLTPSPLRTSPRPITPENSDAAVFLNSPGHAHLTPAKRVQTRTPLSVNTNSPATGTKRKSSQYTSTPLRLAPLASPTTSTTIPFHRLAPLPAPQFTTRTPETSAETDAHIRSHTATLTRLRISDFNNSHHHFDDGPPLPEEVVDASSPGGHVAKRRARSRPVSQELRQQGSPSPAPVAFPRGHSPSSASSSDRGSPLPRRRISAYPPRAPLGRIESAATLFFGPAIISPPRARLTSATSTNLLAAGARPGGRHSYAGPGCSTQAWNTMQTRPATPSPRSSPQAADDMDEFFGPDVSTFNFSVTAGTPSPRAKVPIQKKYSLRDSGVALSEDEDDDFMMPPASTSVSSIYSDSDEGLVTPGLEPEVGSGWPSVVGVDVDEFIQRTLAAGAKGTGSGGPAKKAAPGTPVKRVKTSYLAGSRPWQSAVAHKVGLPGFTWEAKGGKPRKSLPAVFPGLGGGRKHGKAQLDPTTDSEDEDESPSGRRDKYVGLGIGRPGMGGRPRWITRRSSSGAFSSGSESASLAGTPTRAKGRDWHLPLRCSPSNHALNLSPGRSASSSSSSASVLGTPTGARFVPGLEQQRGAGGAVVRRLSDRAVERVGYFQRTFEEVDELGSGEFGKVIKVRSRDGTRPTEYAVKQSKRFEGVRHRLRLREEVEILQLLTCGGVQPNVLTFVDSWEEDNVLYIQTELCELGNFARFLWEYGRVFPRLDEGRIWKIIVDLSDGLQFIHDSGVIHLDLKPSNIFVTGEGRFKIGDFGMASVWPRSPPQQLETESVGFEREGDKVYLAPEVLQGRYGKAADIFSFGMTMLETASNIVVPDQGEAWLRLRREDFSQIDMEDRPELFELIRQMMRTEPELRIRVEGICGHPVVSRAREQMRLEVGLGGTPLGPVSSRFVCDILGRMEEERM